MLAAGHTIFIPNYRLSLSQCGSSPAQPARTEGLSDWSSGAALAQPAQLLDSHVAAVSHNWYKYFERGSMWSVTI